MTTSTDIALADQRSRIASHNRLPTRASSSDEDVDRISQHSMITDGSASPSDDPDEPEFDDAPDEPAPAPDTVDASDSA